MNQKIESTITAIKVLESAEAGLLAAPEVYNILKKYGISGRATGLFGYVKIDRPPVENLLDILTELRKTLVEEALKECLKAMSLMEVNELMERLEEVVNG